MYYNFENSSITLWMASLICAAVLVMAFVYYQGSVLSTLPLWVMQWMHLRMIISQYPRKDTERLLEHTTWYGLPLAYVLSVRGLLYVIWWNLTSKHEADGTESNHNIKTFYRNEFTLPVDKNTAKPTCWHFTALNQKPWLDIPKCLDKLSENKHLIREEFERALAAKSLVAHPDAKTEIASGNWEWNFLYGVGGRNDDSCKTYPLTAALIEELPLNKSFGFVFFSRLTPGTHILPHTGGSSLRHRYHLGLHVPETDNVKIRVGKDWHSWIQDEWIGFDDSYEHEVKHEGKQFRSVLILDLWHPDLTNTERAILSNRAFLSFGKKNPTHLIVKD